MTSPNEVQMPSRRNFIKISTIAAATLAISGCTTSLQDVVQMQSYVNAPEQTLPGENFWFASTCRMCPAACGIIVRMSNGRARKIEGNPNHPLNRGALCAWGQAGLQRLYHPDRLQAVQVRQDDDSWATASWDDILDELATSFEETPKERIAFLTGHLPSSLTIIINRFLEGLDAPKAIIYDTQTAFDGRAILNQAVLELFDENTLPTFDISNADIVLGFGSNFLETWLSPVAYTHGYGQMRSRPGKRGIFIAFEPRMSQTAANADRWIPVAPGDEGLIALALGKLLVNTMGDRLSDTSRAFYDSVDLPNLFAKLAIHEEELQRIAQLFITSGTAVAIPGSGLWGHTNGLETTKAVLILNILAAEITGKSGLYLAPPRPSRDFKPTPPNSLADVVELIARIKQDQIDVLVIIGANPVYELPPSLGFEEALTHVKRIITFAELPDETTMRSHIVLPAHTYLESWGFEYIFPATQKTIISAQQPVVQPLYDTHDPADVFMAIAAKIGGDAISRLPWPNLVKFIQTRLVSLQLQEGNFNNEDLDTFWALWLQHGGWWSQEDLWSPPQLAKEPSFNITARPPQFEGDGDTYPYHLMPIPSVALGDGRHAALPWLQEMPDPMTTASWDTWVEINPTTAKELELQNDDIAIIRTPYGEIRDVVYVFPAIHPGVIAVPIGQGHSALGRYARERGANVFKILAPHIAEDTGHWAWATTRASIEPTGDKRVLPRLENPDGVEHIRTTSLLGEGE